MSSYLYDKYVINFEKNYEDSDKKVFDDFHFDSKSSPAIKDDCQFDISIRFESPSTSWDDFKIKIETKATYKDSSYVVEKEYTLYTIDGSYLSDNLEVPCYWDEL